MYRFLIHDSPVGTWPDRAAPWLSAFADQDVALAQSVAFELTVFEWHFVQLSEVDFAPAHVDVTQVGKRCSRSPLSLVKHLAKGAFCELLKWSFTPPIRQLHPSPPNNACNSSISLTASFNFSTISAAISSGSGKSSVLPLLSSLSQLMSRLSPRLAIASLVNLRKRPSSPWSLRLDLP